MRQGLGNAACTRACSCAAIVSFTCAAIVQHHDQGSIYIHVKDTLVPRAMYKGSDTPYSVAKLECFCKVGPESSGKVRGGKLARCHDVPRPNDLRVREHIQVLY